MGDRRTDMPGQVTVHVAELHQHIDTAVTMLQHVHATRPLDVRSSDARVRGRSSGRSDPTWATMSGWQDELARETSTLVGHVRLNADGDPVDQYGTVVDGDDPRCDISGLVHELYSLAVRLEYVDPPTAANVGSDFDPVDIVDDLRGAPPSSKSWHLALGRAGDYLHELATAIHVGWHRLWQDRWVLGNGGSSVLDEELDREAAMLAGLLRQTVAPFRATAARLVRPPVDQKDIVHCSVCGDLAKYRKLERCNRCRMRELREEEEAS